VLQPRGSTAHTGFDEPHQFLDNVREEGVRANIRRNLDPLAELPGAFCANCAGATCVINQSIASSLRNQVEEWLTE
jgi:hypothetical protein